MIYESIRDHIGWSIRVDMNETEAMERNLEDNFLKKIDKL